MSAIAFIPARSGSKRIVDKNIRPLNGHPLLSYSVTAAVNSGCFDSVICATDNVHYANIARYYGAETPFLRPSEISGDTSPDIEWVRWCLTELSSSGRFPDIFSILRPTSPFRLPSTIRRAFETFASLPGIDSLRAVERCSQHPGKMWILHEATMTPLMPFSNNNVPWHSSQYGALPEVYVQNASLEIAWSHVIFGKNSISGDIISPFITQNLEGLDINSEDDWIMAEHYLRSGFGHLPEISIPPFTSV